jgi:hypothetical protein
MNDLYSTHEKRLDTVMGSDTGLRGWDFWDMVARCWKAERANGLQLYAAKPDGSYSTVNNATMTNWFFETYGILMTEATDSPGMLDRYITIADEEKFSFFLLKWSK